MADTRIAMRLRIVLGLLVCVALAAELIACRGATDPADLLHVHGMVINRSTRSPVGGIVVRAYYPGGCGFFGCSSATELHSTTTDAAGRFSLDFSQGEGVCNYFEVSAVAPSSSRAQFGTYDDNGRCGLGITGDITLEIGP